MNTLKISTLFLSLWGDYGYILFSYLSASLFVTWSSAFSAKSINVSFSWLEGKKIIGKDRKRCSKNQSLLTSKTEKYCYFFSPWESSSSQILPSSFLPAPLSVENLRKKIGQERNRAAHIRWWLPFGWAPAWCWFSLQARLGGAEGTRRHMPIFVACFSHWAPFR